MTEAVVRNDLRHTALFSLHSEMGAQFFPFAGYEMPLHYGRGIIQEHLHSRKLAGLFDVSHMGQIRISGTTRAEIFERLVPGDVVDLPPGGIRYTFLTTSMGGVLDDLMVANHGRHLVAVLNASRKEPDVEHIRAHLGSQCDLEVLHDFGLLALQGPASSEVIARFNPHVASMKFMTVMHARIADIPCSISRSGYTGEDGFEIGLEGSSETLHVAKELLKHQEVALAGLGARDSLRLEAGLCLYGHDLDESTTPVEAGLVWALPKVRRASGLRPGSYPGAAIIDSQLLQGVSRRRVGLLPKGRNPIRRGAQITARNGKVIGQVTSGGFSPVLNAPIAMGYIELPWSNSGSEVIVALRGREIRATVCPLPFVPHKYYRAKG